MVVPILCFRLKIATFFGKFGLKNRNCEFKLKIGTQTKLNTKNSVVMFIFCVFDRKYTFLELFIIYLFIYRLTSKNLKKINIAFIRYKANLSQL